MIWEAPSGNYRPAVAHVRGRLAGETAGALLGGWPAAEGATGWGRTFPGSWPQYPQSWISERTDTRKGHMKKKSLLRCACYLICFWKPELGKKGGSILESETAGLFASFKKSSKKRDGKTRHSSKKFLCK